MLCTGRLFYTWCGQERKPTVCVTRSAAQTAILMAYEACRIERFAKEKR